MTRLPQQFRNLVLGVPVHGLCSVPDGTSEAKNRWRTSHRQGHSPWRSFCTPFELSAERSRGRCIFALYAKGEAPAIDPAKLDSGPHACAADRWRFADHGSILDLYREQLADPRWVDRHSWWVVHSHQVAIALHSITAELNHRRIWPSPTLWETRVTVGAKTHTYPQFCG